MGAPLCSRAGGGARGRAVPPPPSPARAAQRPDRPGCAGQPSARRRPVAAPRGVGPRPGGSAGPRGRALPRAGRVGAGRAAGSWGVGPGKRGCAGGKTEFLLFLENPTSGALPEL